MQVKKRIVITGLGTINAVAHNIPDFVSALLAGVCGIGPLDLFDTEGFRCHNGGQIKNFSPRNYIPGHVGGQVYFLNMKQINHSPTINFIKQNIVILMEYSH